MWERLKLPPQAKNVRKSGAKAPEWSLEACGKSKVTDSLLGAPERNTAL